MQRCSQRAAGPTDRLCQLARALTLRGSSTAEALEAIVDLDFAVLAEIELSRGYGRD
jgi:hypothetical protein